MAKDIKNFNIILVGVGGQGIITLTRILAQAALIERYDVKTSELHGLSQRGGSVEAHVRFGAKIYSPLVKRAGADLIISLEIQETLRACGYGNKRQTVFLVNEFLKPIVGVSQALSTQILQKELKPFSKKAVFVPASKIAKEKLAKEVLAATYLLAYATFKKMLPLRADSILKAIGKVVPKKYLRLNERAFNLLKNG